MRIHLWDSRVLDVRPLPKHRTVAVVKLLKDDKVGTLVLGPKGTLYSSRMTNARYVRLWHSYLGLIEGAIKLGVLPPGDFERVKAEHEKKSKIENAMWAAKEILRNVGDAGIALTSSQSRTLAKAIKLGERKT